MNCVHLPLPFNKTFVFRCIREPGCWCQLHGMENIFIAFKGNVLWWVFFLERYCKYNVLRLSHYFLQLKAMIYWHQWASIAAWFVLCMNKTYKKIKSEFKNYMIICLVIIYLFIYDVTMFSGFYSNQFFTTHEGENFPLANIRRQCVNWCAVKMQLHLTLYWIFFILKKSKHYIL